ncbi:UNVERIFIED_CONTAM: hypothetical protein GTU68_044753 [Idotea baltica]|nr:hypothetical protein [Idotea baltica]
MYILNTTQLL